jgi:hypothetical protein
LPGETATAWDLLEPGAYELTIVSTAPWEKVSVPVSIVAGQTASTTVRLRSR